MNKILKPDVSGAGFPGPRSWEQLKERLGKIFTGLTDDDLNYEEGRKEEMMEVLQARLGKTRAELIAIFEII